MIKKIIYILIFSIVFTTAVYAKPQKLYAKYVKNNCEFNTESDDKELLQKADKNIELAETAKTDADKKYHLQEAMRYYFMLEQMKKDSIEAQIGLGRIYDAMNRDELAKTHFYNAYNFDKYNPKMNLYFADYYYKRHDLVNAIHYYGMAYNYGYSNSHQLNYKMGKTYEKLADLESAKKFYINAHKLNEKYTELTNKIKALEKIDYSKSQYYLFNK